MIAPALSTALGTPVVIDNKAGAGGSVGSRLASRAAATAKHDPGRHDQLTRHQRSLYAKLDYDPIKSFEPVAMLGSGPLVLAVNASSPLPKTLNDVLAASRIRRAGCRRRRRGGHLAAHGARIAVTPVGRGSVRTCPTRAAGRRCRT